VARTSVLPEAILDASVELDAIPPNVLHDLVRDGSSATSHGSRRAASIAAGQAAIG
jgi:hypothetical protein